MSARTVFCGLLFAGVLATPAHAQRLAAEVVADVELWKTDAGSRLLERNGGALEVAAGMHVWGVAELVRGLEVLAIVEAGGSNVSESEKELELEMLTVRWIAARALEIEAGKILMPFGAFGRRRFSHMNPLIGAPDMYPTQYPLGVVVSGSAGAFDYRAALVNLPTVNEGYTPAPGERVRPVIGIGYTAGAAFRAGASMTHGTYLSEDLAARMPAGAAWDDFKQTLVAADARFSAGYVEMRGEIAWSSYDVPTIAEPQHGLGFYTEGRVTLTPRLFTAVRLEKFRYPFVRAGTAAWTGREITQMNAELGVGYRLLPSTLLKVSYRRDYWPGEAPAATPFPDGYAVAAQLSVNLK